MNVGNVTIYGKPKNYTMTRLLETIYPGDTEIKVENIADLDWEYGD